MASTENSSAARPDDPAAPSSSQAQADSAGSASPAQAFKELADYFKYFLSAKLDLVKLALRRAVFGAMAGIIAAVAGLTLVVMSVVLLCLGVADLLGRLIAPWAGNLITGVLLLGGMLLGIWLMISKAFSASRERTVAKYESKRQWQRSQFGRDVETQAARQDSSHAGS